MSDLLLAGVQLPALYAVEGQGGDALALVHLTHPLTGWHWYVLERGTGEDADLLFCLVDGDELEYGYVSLAELAANGVRRDSAWTPEKIGVIEQDARRMR